MVFSEVTLLDSLKQCNFTTNTIKCCELSLNASTSISWALVNNGHSTLLAVLCTAIDQSKVIKLDETPCKCNSLCNHILVIHPALKNVFSTFMQSAPEEEYHKYFLFLVFLLHAYCKNKLIILFNLIVLIQLNESYELPRRVINLSDY